MAFSIIRNEITRVKADAIVNTANPEVAVGAGVDASIYKAAGWERLFAEREKIGKLEPGDAAVTPAFDLDANIIIHTSGPVWRGGDHDEVGILKKCYKNVLRLAAENGCASIAFPLIAAGNYGFPKRLAMETAVECFTAFLEENDIEIMLVVFERDSVGISGELGFKVKEYIDDSIPSLYSTQNLFPAATGAAMSSQAFRAEQMLRADRAEQPRPMFFSDAAPVEKERSEKAKPKLPFMAARKKEKGSAPDFGKGAAGFDMPDEEVCCDTFEDAPAKVPGSLDDRIKEIYKDSFGNHLQMLINKKGLKNSEVYAAANITKQYFSKLLNGQVNPSKEKMLALAVGLHLNMDETVDFLKLAGYAISPISQTDTVVRYFIEHKDYNVLKIDIVLFDYGLDTLSGIAL